MQTTDTPLELRARLISSVTLLEDMSRGAHRKYKSGQRDRLSKEALIESKRWGTHEELIAVLQESMSSVYSPPKRSILALRPADDMDAATLSQVINEVRVHKMLCIHAGECVTVLCMHACDVISAIYLQ